MAARSQPPLFAKAIAKRATACRAASLAVSPTKYLPEYSCSSSPSVSRMATVCKSLSRRHASSHARRSNLEFFAKFRRIDEIDGRLEELQKQHAEVMTLRRLPHGSLKAQLSIGNRDCESVSASRPQIWLQGGMHACEWIGPATVMYLLEALLARQEELPGIDVHIVPVVNMDGYIHSWTKDRFWRNCLSGVNPNLNFPTHFGQFGLLERLFSRPHLKTSPVHPGPEALSEPCCRSIADELLTLRPKGDLHLFVDFHSYGLKWGYPPVYGHAPSPTNLKELEKVSNLATSAARKVHGVAYEVCQLSEFESVGGTIMDWAQEELGAKFCFTVELRPGFPAKLQFLKAFASRGLAALHDGFELPEEQIVEVGEEMEAALFTVLRTTLPKPSASLVQ